MTKKPTKNKEQRFTPKKVIEQFFVDCKSVANKYLKRYKKSTSRHSNQQIAKSLLTHVTQQQTLLEKVSKADYKRIVWSSLNHLYGVQRTLFYRSRLRR